MSEAPHIHVPNELFAPAESSYFTGKYELSELAAGPDTFTFDKPLDWNVTITNTGGALLIDGTIEGEAETACARCLADFRIPLKGQIEGYFLLSSDEEAPEDMDDDEFDVLGEDNMIDMVPLLNAALLIEFPLIPLHAPDCKGLCPTCGQNLNEKECTCKTQEEENSQNPFAILKDYPFKSSN